MAPLSMPQSYYLTVLPQEMSFNTFVEKFVLKKISRKNIKLGTHCFRKVRVNLMYANLTYRKFALIFCNVNFLGVVNMHR